MVEAQFDFITGKYEADKGMDLATGAQRAQEWKHRAEEWLHRKPQGYEFTADDLIYAVGTPDEKKNNAIGGWLAAKARERRIYFTGRMIKSTRVSRHTGLQRQWSIR